MGDDGAHLRGQAGPRDLPGVLPGEAAPLGQGNPVRTSPTSSPATSTSRGQGRAGSAGDGLPGGACWSASWRGARGQAPEGVAGQPPAAGQEAGKRDIHPARLSGLQAVLRIPRPRTRTPSSSRSPRRLNMQVEGGEVGPWRSTTRCTKHAWRSSRPWRSSGWATPRFIPRRRWTARTRTCGGSSRRSRSFPPARGWRAAHGRAQHNGPVPAALLLSAQPCRPWPCCAQYARRPLRGRRRGCRAGLAVQLTPGSADAPTGPLSFRTHGPRPAAAARPLSPVRWSGMARTSYRLRLTFEGGYSRNDHAWRSAAVYPPPQ